MTLSLHLPTLEDTERLGALLAARARVPLDVHLHGELGAGKSTVVRACVRALGYAGAVPSPTYTLVEEYRLAERVVQHLDLYRLADPEELEYIGWRDYVAEPALRFIEWAERGAGYLAPPNLDIRLELLDAGRRAIVQAQDAATEALVAALEEDWAHGPG